MKDFDINDVIPDEVGDSSGSIEDQEHWAAVIRPPEEYDSDPRDVAERLFSRLHGDGSMAFEAHSDGANVSLQLVDGDRATARSIARHARAELGARADVMRSAMPVDEGDQLAGATFQFKKDAIYPPETARTDDGAVGTLRHVLDTLAEEEVKGAYQVCMEPINGDWTSRRGRSLPASIEGERDIKSEGKRAAVVMMPMVAASVWLSPWPFETSLAVGMALMVAATIGEGVRVPREWTAEEMAHEHRERAKERYGARSQKAKDAKKTADVVGEQGGARGWRLSVRLIVGSDNGAVAMEHCKRLSTQIERAFSSSVTGQELVSTRVTGEDAQDVLTAIRSRRVGRPSMSTVVRRALAHGTRKEMRGAPFVVSSLGYFPGKSGGGGDSREFSTPTETSKSLPDDAPAYSRSGVVESPEYLFDYDETETKRHREFGEIETKLREYIPDDDDEYYAGEYVRELAESRTRTGNVYFGIVEDGGSAQEIGIAADQLPRHIFICGASGAGKTTLAEFLSMQHGHAGRGFAVIDPHNDLVDDLKKKLPEERLDDIIAIDPQDTASDRTITINFLDVDVAPESDDYESAVNAAVSDIVSVLGQGASQMGDRMKPYIRAISRGMIVSEQSYTLLDMREFFIDQDRREEFAMQMRSEGRDHIADVAEEVAEVSRNDLSPITRLLQKWVLSPVSRQIIENEESSFSFREALKNDRIILVRNNLSDNDLQRLVATSIYRKIMRAACSRPQGERSTFPVVIDEVDDIESDEMNLGSDLSNARKWGVSLCLMTQHPGRLNDLQEDLETNCKTFVSYACPSSTHAKAIASMYECDTAAIGKLGDFRSQIQLDIGGERVGPFKTLSPAPIPPVRDEDDVEERIDMPSRECFGVERENAKIVEPDGGLEETDPMDEFMQLVADGAASGELIEDEHFAIVHEGKPQETVRINPSRVIETLGCDDVSDAEEITSLSKERVGEETGYITGHRVRTPEISRGLGASMSDLTGALTGVDRGMFIDR